MATAKWVTVKTKWCEAIEAEATLKEHRVYPNDVIPSLQPYRVTARQCTAAIACNMKGYPCQWAFTNPDLDRFEIA